MRGHRCTGDDCRTCEQLAEQRATAEYDFDGSMADREADRYEREGLGL